LDKGSEDDAGALYLPSIGYLLYALLISLELITLRKLNGRDALDQIASRARLYGAPGKPPLLTRDGVIVYADLAMK
jgi:hypothetical protein